MNILSCFRQWCGGIERAYDDHAGRRGPGNRLSRQTARVLMKSGAMRGYACRSCPRENFWHCKDPYDDADIVVCNPSEVVVPAADAPSETHHVGPYR